MGMLLVRVRVRVVHHVDAHVDEVLRRVGPSRRLGRVITLIGRLRRRSRRGVGHGRRRGEMVRVRSVHRMWRRGNRMRVMHMVRMRVMRVCVRMRVVRVHVRRRVGEERAAVAAAGVEGEGDEAPC